MIYIAKKQAVDDVHGDNMEQFTRVWDYAETLKKYNPNSWIKVVVLKPERSLHPRF